MRDWNSTLEFVGATGVEVLRGSTRVAPQENVPIASPVAYLRQSTLYINGFWGLSRVACTDSLQYVHLNYSSLIFNRLFALDIRANQSWKKAPQNTVISCRSIYFKTSFRFPYEYDQLLSIQLCLWIEACPEPCHAVLIFNRSCRGSPTGAPSQRP